METDISNFLGLFIIIPIGLIQFGYLYYLFHNNDQEIKTIKTCIINSKITGDKLKILINDEIKQQLGQRNQPAKQNQNFSEIEKDNHRQKIQNKSTPYRKYQANQQNNECEQIKQKFQIFEQQKNDQLQKLDQSLNNTLNKFAELELKFQQCEATKNAVSEVKGQIPSQDVSTLQTQFKNAINQYSQEHQVQIDELQNNIQHQLNSLGLSQLEHKISQISSQMEQINQQLSQQVELVKQQIENQQRLLQQKCEQKDILNTQNQISNAVNQLQDQINELKNINLNQPNPLNSR